MNALLTAGVINAALASLMAAGTLAVCYRWTNPFVARGFWLAVMARFIAPPILLLPLVSIPTSLLEPGSPAIVMKKPSQLHARESLAALPATAVLDRASSQTLPMAIAYGPFSPQSGDLLRRPWFDYRHLPAVAFSVWMGGSLLMLTIAVLRIYGFHRQLQITRLAAADLQERVDGIASQVGLSRSPQVRLADMRLSPLVWCMGRPAIIVLPIELVRRLDDDQLTVVLAHELTHIRRRDCWARWLELIVVGLFWWCPVAWWARRALHEAEERCCDADTLAKFPKLRRKFADALLITLDYLARAKRMEFAATGLARRGSLTRRFEMILNVQPQSRLSRSRQVVLMCAALAALIATPIAATPPAGPAAASNSLTESSAPAGPSPQRCTIRLNDGTSIDGEILSRAGDRIVVLKRGVNESNKAENKPASEEARTPEPQSQVWELSLDECFAIALNHDDRVTVTTLTDGSLVLGPANSSGLNDLDFRDFLERGVRDIHDAYWILWQIHKDLDVVKSGQAAALQTWRKATARERAGAAGRPSDEASSRSQYFLFRGQCEALLTDIHRSEARLRALLKLSSTDGRLIRPADEPRSAEVGQNFGAIFQEAMESRVEVVRQRRKIERRTIKLRATELANAEGGHEPSITERRQQEEQRHLSLLLDRERAVLVDMQLEIKHQLGDAVREYELCSSIVETNRNRAEAANDEVKAVESLFEIGRASLDLLLDAQRRSVEARTAYNAALANLARATARLHQRQGSTLELHGIRLVRAAAE